MFDLHGDVAAAETAAQTQYAAAIRYDPYGQTADTYTNGTGGIALAWKFQGRLDISPSGDPLYDAGARFYAPYLGQFTQLDSVTGKPTDPRSMNRFLYAEGNPWSMVDPSGHASFYEGGGCGPGGMYCGSHGNDQNAHTNALIVANNGTPNPGPSYIGPAWKPLATPTTETDRAADNPSFSFNLADRGQDNASLRSSPTCRWAGRAGCVTIGSGNGDSSGLIIVAGVVIGALVCVAGVCEAIALAATGAAAAEGVIATAAAAASGACMVLCDKLQAIGNGFMGAYGGSGPPEAALVSYSEQAATRAAETQAQLGASSGFVTMAAGVGARADGSIVTLVASSEARATLRLGVTLNPGDILVRGSGHAEQQILQAADSMGLSNLAVAAGRPICPICASAISSAGAIPASPLKMR